MNAPMVANSRRRVASHPDQPMPPAAGSATSTELAPIARSPALTLQANLSFQAAPPIHHVIPAGRIRGGPALLQPHVSPRAGDPFLERRLDRSKGQVLGRPPKLGGKAAEEKLTVVAGYLQDPVGQRLASSPPSVRPSPILPGYRRLFPPRATRPTARPSGLPH